MLLAAMLLLVLLCASLALAADGESGSTTANPGQPDELTTSPIPAAAEELPTKRTATSRTYELPNGASATEVFQAPINYQAPGGDWRPIGTDLHEITRGAGLTNGPNSFDLRLPNAMGEDAVRVFKDGQWVSYRLLEGSAELAKVDGEKATYEAAGRGIAFELTSIATGVKEDIVLDSASAPSSFEFELKASDGLVPRLAKDGSIRFEDGKEKLFAVLPPPTLSDSSERPQLSDAVSYSLSEGAADSWRLAVTADRAWLENPERAWPVRVDPTVSLSPAIFSDVTITSLPVPAGWRYAGWQWPALSIGFQPTEVGIARALLKFDLPTLPPGASLYDATVATYSSWSAENTAGLAVHPLDKSWGGLGVDWTRAENFSGALSYWTNPGGDFGPVVASIKTSEREGGSAPGPWNFNSPTLTDLASDWLSAQKPNNGVLIAQTEETSGGNRYAHLNSSSASTPELRPKLVLKYWDPAPSTAKVTSPTDGTTTARRLKLQATWASGVTGITWLYREGKAGSFKEVPEEFVRDGEGNAVSAWPVDTFETNPSAPLYLDASQLSATLRKKGGPIQVRPLFEGGAQGVSSPVEAKIDPALGGPKDATAEIGPGSVDLLTGNFTVTRTDVSIPTFSSSLDFSRTFSSRDAASPGNTGVLGPGWEPGVPVEEGGAGAWRSVRLVTETYEEAEEAFSFTYALATGVEGAEVPFEQVGSSYRTPDELPGWSLTSPNANEFVLRTPDGTKTTFSNGGSGSEYLPKEVSQPGASTNSTRMVYEVIGGNRRLTQVVAPSVPGIDCSISPKVTFGCKSLSFVYIAAAWWGAPSSYGDRLQQAIYHAPGVDSQRAVAVYDYNSSGQLTSIYDPRIGPTPLLEHYTYTSTGQIGTITPPGLKPWTMEYGTLNEEEVSGRLLAVKRDSLVAGIAQTTVAYGVPVSGSGAPYPMSGSDVAKWNQTDVPVDATAIFPPDQVPTSSPPSDYSRATVYYMDSDGYAVNTATPKGAGTEAASISTAETDKYGNVVRELTPQNRLRSLAAGAESVARSKQLDTRRLYAEEGTEMVEEVGPLHDVRLESTGEVVPARSYRYVEYDQVPSGVTLPTPAPHLPTTEKTAALVSGLLKDTRVNKTEYDWTLRKPTKTIVDAGEGGLNIASVTAYNELGLPTEIRQPSDAGAPGAGTTRISYYSFGAGGCILNAYAGLPCRIEPASQPGTPGQPKVVVKWLNSYNALGAPTEIVEAPGWGAPVAQQRTTITAYDTAGRVRSVKRTGGGAAVPKVEMLYQSTTGAPRTQHFVCESECGTPTYTSAFGTPGSGTGQLKRPMDVALDSSGNHWVIDRENNRLLKYGSGGSFVAQFGSAGSGNGQFSAPNGLEVTPNDHIWVADSGNDRIQEFDQNGAFVKAVKFSDPATDLFDIASGPGGILWVTDRGLKRVVKLNEAGAVLATAYGKQGAPYGSATDLGAPTGIVTDADGSVWVADNTGAPRVFKYSSSGKYLFEFGTGGSGDGQFWTPVGIDIAPSGNVVLVDGANNRIQEFLPNGTYLRKFGTTGTGTGQFTEPRGMTLGSGNTIIVADTGNKRIQKWTIANPYDDQAVTTSYDELGRATEYTDADGNTSETTYDLLGRPVTTDDGKGTQTRSYDATTGLLTKLEDSAAGTFTASYDADGNLTEEGLPNGLVAEQTYDEAGELTNLVYDKVGSAWLDFDAERSIHGQILWQKSLTSRQEYSYDKAGRLVKTKDWDAAVGGDCTTREYVFGEPGYEELPGKNTNRTRMMTRTPGVGGACTTTGGSEQKYKYDGADRLINEGVVYDDYGRTTSLPAVFAGGKTLITSYFSTDMVASQTQDGVTNTFQLDADLRQRQRTQGGGLEGVEVFHYAGPSDTPAWTQLGAKWTRNISGIGGGIGAIQDSSSETLLQLSNLHGDVVATATLNPSDTEPVATFEHDEYGVPKVGGAQQFGWLGSKGRRTEFSSGVIQMGARSYVPALGRFLSPDPILGGSANPYEYAAGDPVNNVDLTGEKCAGKDKAWIQRCKAAIRKVARERARYRKAIRRLRAVVRAERAAKRETLIHVPSFRFPNPMNTVEDFVQNAYSVIKKVDEETDCSNMGGVAGSAGGGLYAGADSVFGVGTKGARAARWVAKRAGGFGLALTFAGGIGAC